MIHATHKNVQFSNQINEEISRSGVIYQQTIIPHELCYQCFQDDPDSLFGKLRIGYCRDKPYFPAKIESLSFQIQINTLFKDDYVRK